MGRLSVCAECRREHPAPEDLPVAGFDDPPECECMWGAEAVPSVADVQASHARYLAHVEASNRARRERLGLPGEPEAPGLVRPGPRYCTSGHPVHCHPSTLTAPCHECRARNVEILPAGADAFLARAYEVIELERRFVDEDHRLMTGAAPGSLARAFADELLARALERLDRLTRLAAETRALIDAHNARAAE